MNNLHWPNKKNTLLCCGIPLLLMLAVGVSSCSKGGGQDKPGVADKKAKPPVPVLTAKVRAADVPVELHAIGGVEACQSSPVRAQVGGILTEIHFQEGDFVKAGQVLFVIDQTPLKANLKQLQANLARDEAQIRNAEAQSRNAEAQLQNARAMAKRYEQLVQKDFVTREQYDQRLTNVAAAQATLDASQASSQAAKATTDSTKAALETVAIQLGYTEIHAPISGQTGSLLAKQGDLIKANDTNPLVIVNQIEPIRVRFSANEEKLAEILKYREQGSMDVRVTPPGGGEGRDGRLVFVDNAVDPATATIALKAELPNSDHALWPGQFVDTSMTLRTIKAAFVIPASAVLTGQKGDYVYVVDAEGLVSVRLVKPGIAAGEDTEITEGLALAETVVTDGQLRLSPGAKVIEKTGLRAEPERQKASPDAKTQPDKSPADKAGKPVAREKTP